MRPSAGGIGARCGIAEVGLRRGGAAACLRAPVHRTRREAVRLIRRLSGRFVISGLHAHFGTAAVNSTRTTTGTPTQEDAVLPEFLRPREAAGMLRMSERSLKRCRAEGSAPVHYMFGNRIVYARADLAEWAAARRHRSTAETGWS